MAKRGKTTRGGPAPTGGKGLRGKRGRRGPPGQRGLVGQRGKTGLPGQRGPKGPTGLPQHDRVLAIVEQRFADVAKELDIQLRRIAQIQHQLDELATIVRRLQLA